MDQESSRTFSLAGGNSIRVTDVPIGGTNEIRVTLGVTNGTLTLSRTDGLTGSGNGTGSLTYTGTLSAINAALDGMAFTPTSGYSGPAELTMTSNNLAGPELGGDLTDTDTLAITVVPLATSPTITPATTTANTQTTGGLVITPAAATPGVTHFQITGITSGTLYLADGTTAIAEGSFISAAQGAAGLRFTPATDFVGQATFTARGATSADFAGLVGSPATGSITVNRQATTTSLNASATAATVGQSLTFTATVNPAARTGTVTFLAGETTLGTATLSGGTATFTTDALPAGSHSITAR